MDPLKPIHHYSTFRAPYISEAASILILQWHPNTGSTKIAHRSPSCWSLVRAHFAFVRRVCTPDDSQPKLPVILCAGERLGRRQAPCFIYRNIDGLSSKVETSNCRTCRHKTPHADFHGSADQKAPDYLGQIASIASEGQATQSAPFGNALAALADQRQDIVGRPQPVQYTDLHIFAKAHPDRFYQMGMAEPVADECGSENGPGRFVPFATIYALFGTSHAYELFCMDIAEENFNVKIVGGLPSLNTGYGPSR